MDTKKRRADHAATAAERPGVQRPQAHHRNCQKPYDLAREAVRWNGMLGYRLVGFTLGA